MEIEEKKIFEYVLRNNLSCYTNKVFNFLNPGNQYYSSWHIDLITEYLNEVEKGRIKRLIINIPPRCLKSVCASVAWTSWLLGRKPSSRIITASYSAAISTKLSLDTRFVLESEWYRSLFPKTRISKKHNRKTKFLTSEHGFRMASSVGGSITGEGADYLIVDDPHNPTHMHSEKMRNKAIDWFTNTFSSRLNNRKEGKIIVIMQRLHAEDLCGYLLGNQKSEWELLKIPLVSNSEKIYSIGSVSYIRCKNEVINNHLFSNDTVSKLIAEIGEANFEAQYQQQPVSNFNSFLSEESFCYYDHLPEDFENIYQSWDTAVKISEDSDYSAYTCWGEKNGKYYLIFFINERLEYPDLKKRIIAEYNKYNPVKLIIEDKSSGQSIIQDLKRENIKNIEAIKPTKDKVSRFASVIEMFDNHKVMFPKTNHKFRIVKDALLKFPAIKHDDLVDSVSQFLNYIKFGRAKSQPQIRNF